MSEIARDQITDFRQDDIGNEQCFGILRHKRLSIAMPRVSQIEQRKKEATVYNEIQGSMLLEFLGVDLLQDLSTAFVSTSGLQAFAVFQSQFL